MRAIFDAQRSAFTRDGAPDYEERLRALWALRDTLKARKQELADAISQDFGQRSRYETALLELFPTLDAIRHTQQHLRSWMQPRPVSTGWPYWPARGRLMYQPLGVVGIIGAWNYPLLLTLAPLINAVAAGNHVMLKPSELTPCLAEKLREILSTAFPAERVAVLTGGPAVGAEFASLPFDHLLFTGSAQIGKLVMRAASENLTPVTLELGGKSPVFVHETYPVAQAMHRILKGKLYNAGQTCIAPDYVLVHESRLSSYIQAAERMIPELYPRLVDNPDYTRILNSNHYERLRSLVEDARTQGASVTAVNPAGERCDSENRVFPPTLVTGVRDTMRIAEEEIFGPILPFVTYTETQQAIEYITARPRPLALYCFDRNSARAVSFLERTHSGTAAVNDVVLQIGPNDLPFGGVGASGMGRYRGFHGFETFSNRKSVFLQSRFSPLDYVRPPYRRAAALISRLLT
jgi:coniferyl-aldehyde dehydrogenase